jgi:dTDP-4-amino-4,6-dideoxygalactose transaminase
MKIPFVDLNIQYESIKVEIDDAIKNVINESGFVRSRFVDQFENDFAKLIGIKNVVSCGNGTDSLYILMKGLGLKPGDEVITTAHSWISTSETITQAGGKVVFCDTNIDTFTIDPKLIESKITNRTVGIIPVHLYGQPADMDPILEIAKRRNLWVIEDCAQAHMAEYKGKMVGTMGTAASFSFYPGKNLGAMGDAGCIATNDDNLADWCKLFARHGGKGQHTIEGINSRMDGLQAAILSVKIPYLKDWTSKRIQVAQNYDKLLSSNLNVATPQLLSDTKHVYHLYVLKVNNRDQLNISLNENGIGTMLNYPIALPFLPAYGYLGHKASDFPNSFQNQGQIISIPIFPEITLNQQEYIVELINEYYKSK